MNRRQFITGAPVALLPIGAGSVETQKVAGGIPQLEAGMPPNEYMAIFRKCIDSLNAMAEQWNNLPPLRRGW